MTLFNSPSLCHLSPWYVYGVGGEELGEGEFPEYSGEGQGLWE